MVVPIITIAHHVFLTREQRYALAVPESEIEVIGCCSPVWIQSGKHLSDMLEEVFAKYRIKNCPEPEKNTISFMEEGFFIKISPEMSGLILDYEDGGQEFLSLTHKNVIYPEDKAVPIVHFLNMESINVLEETLC